MEPTTRRFALFSAAVVGALLLVALANFLQAERAVPNVRTITYSQFLDAVEEGRVRSVTLAGRAIAGTLTDRTAIRSFAADDPDLVKTLRQKGVAIAAEAPPEAGPSFLGLAATLLPTLIFIVIAVYFMSRSQGGGGRAGAFGKSKARLLAKAEGRVTFADVAGVDEAKEDLQEIVEFLKSPQKFQRLGGRIPRGVLLVGPPGSGKTLLARAIAGEADAPFFSISGSDFVEMFVGVGASRVRDMFAEAKKSAPCIIFIDEIDAVGRRRGAGLGQGNDEREQTLNQLLVELDGFAANQGIILIAATNRPDVLDPALVRPGRFDREIVVDNPDVGGREAILRVHIRSVPLADDVDVAAIARRTPGFSGADLANLVNEAALLTARRGHAAVGAREFDDARDKVTMGAERRTYLMTEEERRQTAIREGGRALVALHLPAADPIHRVTIVPRGRSMGMTKLLPQNDQHAHSLDQLTARLAVLLAGRAAEETALGRGSLTSAAGADLEEATKLARQMVTRWGFSEALGAVAYEENEEEVFLGHSVARQQTISEDDARKIGAEIRKLMDAALAEGKRILSAHRGDLDRLVATLLERETLTGEEVAALLAAGRPARLTA